MPDETEQTLTRTQRERLTGREGVQNYAASRDAEKRAADSLPQRKEHVRQPFISVDHDGLKRLDLKPLGRTDDGKTLFQFTLEGEDRPRIEMLPTDEEARYEAHEARQNELAQHADDLIAGTGAGIAKRYSDEEKRNEAERQAAAEAAAEAQRKREEAAEAERVAREEAAERGRQAELKAREQRDADAEAAKKRKAEEEAAKAKAEAADKEAVAKSARRIAEEQAKKARETGKDAAKDGDKADAGDDLLG